MKCIAVLLFLCTIASSFAQQEEPDFLVPIRVTNLRGAYQVLEFGTAPDATTGDECACLDTAYGEFELPLPASDSVFDARWLVSNSRGTHINILSRAYPNYRMVTQYRCIVQGGIYINPKTGQTGNNYPIYIGWRMSQIPAKNDTMRNPAGGSWWIIDTPTAGGQFKFNMNTGQGVGAPAIRLEKSDDGDSVTLVVERVNIRGITILYDHTSPVEEEGNNGFSSITPNPLGLQGFLRFHLNNETFVSARILDALGNPFLTLAEGIFPAGENSLPVDNGDMPSGLYFYELIAGGRREVRRFISLR